MSMIIKWALKTVLGRYVTAGVVAMLLGGGALMWHNFKDNLREEGAEECVQIVNAETHQRLVDALAAEKAARLRLAGIATASAEENAAARARLKESESRMESLSAAMKEQEKNDEEYAEWRNAPLPSGVGERMRNLAGTDSGSVRNDSN